MEHISKSMATHVHPSVVCQTTILFHTVLRQQHFQLFSVNYTTLSFFTRNVMSLSAPPTQESYQEHDVVWCVGHKGASAENLQEPGAEGPARGEKQHSRGHAICISCTAPLHLALVQKQSIYWKYIEIYRPRQLMARPSAKIRERFK